MGLGFDWFLFWEIFEVIGGRRFLAKFAGQESENFGRNFLFVKGSPVLGRFGQKSLPLGFLLSGLFVQPEGFIY